MLTRKLNLTNKFWWTKLGVRTGTSFLNAMGYARKARLVGIDIAFDPRLMVAERVVDQVVPLAIHFGNEAWKNEIKSQNKHFSKVNFIEEEKKHSLLNEVKTGWTDVDYWDTKRELNEYIAKIEVPLK